MRVCELVDRHAPALVLVVDELTDDEATWAFETIGAAAARVLSEILQQRVDRDA